MARESTTKRKTFRLSPKSIALRKQQGQFMGIVRHLPKMERRRLAKIRKEQGYSWAIREAKAELLRRS